MTKLFVGNLPFTATEDSVRALFTPHGTVETLALINDRDTGRPRGFGFVEMAVICVSDDGPGIEAKDLAHIFDRFYRSTKAVKNTKGAGLGLYLARAIIEAHGGRIWADPKPDAGARICFSLPR